jgi:L,D-peptidoglycan transpeptidase YkuD (ErfK/YbiS/YcfS/YnhG family)
MTPKMHVWSVQKQSGAILIFTATADGWLQAGDARMRCALGPAGVIPAAEKREGDGASPAGVWPIRRVLYRPDRGPAPETALQARPIAEDDGWCDAPEDPAYNRPVSLPYPASAERMWREDHLYDIVVVLGHNDDPPVAGLGSAIFLHLAKPDFSPTHGCVALAKGDLERLLRLARPGDALEIRSQGA